MPTNSIEDFENLSSQKYAAAILPVITTAMTYMCGKDPEFYLPYHAEQMVHFLVAHRELEKERLGTAIQEARRSLATASEVHTCIVTISLNQKSDKRETVKKIKEIIDFISTLSLEEPLISCEFFSAEGWNPHLHIFMYNSKRSRPGAIAQRLRRLLVPKYPLVYRVHCKQGKASSQSNYLISLKKESKREHQVKDEEFRKENGLEDYYLL